MNENDGLLDRTAQKEKIRQRYRGVSTDELELIPALPKTSLYDEENEKRVAVYARVSTGDPRQTSSYELQRNHYLDVVERHIGWKLVDIYADEGISGTSLQHRDEFIRMINDCKEHKIDLIVTKSVSRFARNVVDCISYARELAKLNPPIGILFETEGIYTLDSRSEMQLSFMATTAQEESHNKSEIMNASIEMRFRRGIFLTPVLLGYDHDEDGNLVINPEEAKTVRLIFFMYLYGYSSQEIADKLTYLKATTKKGNTQWSPSSVIQILQNERYCGDVLARKTWTPSYLDHKSKKNKQDRNQYRQNNHHEPIITRSDFIAVQKLINNAKYGTKGILPELHVIDKGALTGFVTVHTRWAGFTVDDYIKASSSVIGDNKKTNEETIQARIGEFDFRGYEITRTHFFSTRYKMSVTFTAKSINFSTACIRKMNDITHIELLINPILKLMAIRKSNKESKCAVQWCKVTEAGIIPRAIQGKAFMSTLYSIFGWKPECSYRILGIYQNKEDDSTIIFNMAEPEIYIPVKNIQVNLSGENPDSVIEPLVTQPNSVCAYPEEWTDNFGNDFYSNSKEISSFSDIQEWDLQSRGQPYTNISADVTEHLVIRNEIDNLIDEKIKLKEMNDPDG